MKYSIAVFLLASAGGSFAQDVTAPSAYNWTGAYLGVDGGASRNQSLGELHGEATLKNGQLDSNGKLLAVHAGYQYEFSNAVVLGFELDYSPSRFSADSLLYDAGSVVPSNTLESELRWSASGRIRLGYAFDAFLPYVSLGRSFARYDYTPDYASTAPLPGSKVHQGVTVGVGLNYAISEHWVAKVEYRYTNFGQAIYPVAGYPTNFSHIDLRTQDLRLGLSYKF